jgi:hypothetical protein
MMDSVVEDKKRDMEAGMGSEMEVEVKSPKSKKVPISLDNSVEDAVKYDKDGLELSFDSTPGKFLELPDEVVKGLSVVNRTSYALSYLAHQTEVKQQDVQPTEDLSIYARYSTPIRRLEVRWESKEREREFRKRWHLCWKRPDELQYCQSEGYSKVTKSDGVISFAYDEKRGIHVVGVAGQPELVLMKCPVEVYEGKLREAGKQSKLNDGAATSQFESAAARAGYESFHPNTSQIDKKEQGALK